MPSRLIAGEEAEAAAEEITELKAAALQPLVGSFSSMGACACRRSSAKSFSSSMNQGAGEEVLVVVVEVVVVVRISSGLAVVVDVVVDEGKVLVVFVVCGSIVTVGSAALRVLLLPAVNVGSVVCRGVAAFAVVVVVLRFKVPQLARPMRDRKRRKARSCPIVSWSVVIFAAAADDDDFSVVIFRPTLQLGQASAGGS